MSYSTKIVREQGGSVLRMKSGASLVLESGALFSPAGNTEIQSGASIAIADGGSLTVKSGATAKGQMYAIMNMGPNTWFFAPASPGSPITSASPGDMLWIGGSLPSLWVNTSNGTTGSAWKQFRQDGSSSTPAGP